jgi:hypothetical protein
MSNFREWKIAFQAISTDKHPVCRVCDGPLDKLEACPPSQAECLASELLQTSRDFLGIFAAVERGNAKVAFALRPESAPRCDDNV